MLSSAAGSDVTHRIAAPMLGGMGNGHAVEPVGIAGGLQFCFTVQIKAGRFAG